MHKLEESPPGLVALAVGVFIGLMLVLPAFGYQCFVNAHLTRENLDLRASVARLKRQQVQTPTGQVLYNGPIGSGFSLREGYFCSPIIPAVALALTRHESPERKSPRSAPAPLPAPAIVREAAMEKEWNEALNNPAVSKLLEHPLRRQQR